MASNHETLYYKNSAIFNTIGYIMVIVINAMAGSSMINNLSPAEVSEKYESLFVPAALTFSIWGLIYLSLLGFIIYQLWLAFSGHHQQELEIFMERLRGWWLISCLANSCWLFAWHYELLPLSFLLILTLLVCLLAINLNFNIALPQAYATRAEKLLIHLPFSLYLGWICIAAIGNMAALFVYAGLDMTSIPWTIFLILLSTVASTVLIIRRYNIVAGLVALWALYGIILKRQTVHGPDAGPVITTCITAMSVITLAGVWRILKRPSSW